MIEIEAPGAGQFEVSLELEDVDRKGLLAAAPPRVTLGEPIVIHLSKKLLQKDADAAAHLEQSPDRMFHLVRLACTFRPAADERFKEAWLRVLCEPAESTIAWSMLPHRDADLDESSHKVSLSADLKLLGVGAEPAVEASRTRKRIRPFIDALNLQQSDPQWQFKPTPARELEGSFPLALVLRSLKSKPCSGAISLRCVVERRRFLFTYVSATVGRSLAFRVHE
jgi:hypothetical protein